MKIKIALSIALLSGMVILGGCKKWLDKNQDPNVTLDVPLNMLLSAAQVEAASPMGSYMQINGSIWAQYWTQAPASSQYKIYEQYSPSANDYDNSWSLFYNESLMDLQTLEQKARASNAKDYLAVSILMKAYIFQVITDAWGDVPFSEALKGRPEDGGILSPKYDPQEQVYAGINNMIDSARSLIEELQTSNVAGDLIFGGDLNKWWKFANTLQLKVNLRLSEKSPAVAQAGVQKVYAIAGDESGFLAEGEDAKIDFTTTAGNQNPLYSEMSGLGKVQNLVASQTVIDRMLSNNDYRIYYFYQDDGGFAGIPQGAYNLPASTFVSIPSTFTGANADDVNSGSAPVWFMSSYESYFLQAEASARGWGTGDAEALYEEGVFASYHTHPGIIEDLDITLRNTFSINDSSNSYIFKLNTDYAAYSYIHGDTLTGFVLDGDGMYVPVAHNPPAEFGAYPSGGSIEDQVKTIITQKWFSMTGTQGFEAWTEWRRTGYPDFFSISANTIIGQKFPERFLYPNVELTRNQKFPGQPVITQKVWWDAN